MCILILHLLCKHNHKLNPSPPSLFPAIVHALPVGNIWTHTLTHAHTQLCLRVCVCVQKELKLNHMIWTEYKQSETRNLPVLPLELPDATTTTTRAPETAEAPKASKAPEAAVALEAPPSFPAAGNVFMTR